MADADTTDAPPEGDAEPKGNLPDDPAVLRAELDKVRKEAAGYRTKAKELEDRDKTELQRLQDTVSERDSTIADLPRIVRQQAIRFASEASKAGFLDPEDALAFIDVDLSDGDAVKAALEALAERKPHLVRQAEAKKRVPTRPKPAGGDAADGDEPGAGLKGKERAAAALRQFKNT